MAAFHRIERQAFEGMSTRSTEIERPVNCFALDSFTYGNRTEGSRNDAKTQRKPQSIWPSPPMGTDTNSLCSLCLCVLKKIHRNPPLLPILLRFSPHLRIPFLIDLNMDRISSAADGTIFHVRLTCTFRQIQRDDDFFAASVADIASFFLR